MPCIRNKLLFRFFSTNSAIKTLDDEYAALLRSCARTKSLPQAKYLHHRLASEGHLDTSLYLGNIVVQMYGSCYSVEDARLVFDQLPRRNKFSWNILIAVYTHNGHLQLSCEAFQKMSSHDVVSWNTYLTVIAENAPLEKALHCFGRMPVSSEASWNVILQANARSGDIVQTKNFFDSMPVRNSLSWTIMMDAFGEAGKVNDVQKMFDQIPQMNLLAGTIMVHSFAECGLLFEAKELFEKLPERDEFLWNVYIDAFSKGVGVENAEKAFAVMPERSVVTWNSMIQAFALSSRLEQANECFHKMPQRNRFTWNSMIQIMSMNGEVEAANSLFDSTPERDIITWNTHLHALVQENENPETLKSVFRRFPVWNYISFNIMMQSAHAVDLSPFIFESSVNHDNLVAWNSMISSYSRAGQSEAAVHLFRVMDLEGVKPDAITYLHLFDACSRMALAKANDFVSSFVEDEILEQMNVANAILSMFGKTGLAERAWSVFTRMPHHDSISWNAMLTAYTRTGHSKEALELFHEMALEGFNPCVISFVNILCACSHVGLVERARDYFCSMAGDYELSPIYDHYVCMTDLLARAGRLEQAEELVNVMPFEPEYEAQMALLGACRSQGDLDSGNRAAMLFPEPSGFHSPFLLLSHLHAVSASKTS